MRRIPLIFSAFGSSISIILAILCYINDRGSEASAWSLSALWAINCMIYDLRDFRNKK